MGSRAVVVVAKDIDTARTRFGIEEDENGVIVTRTGRRFFNDQVTESELLNRLSQALTASDIWARHDTSWVCLDCELMPWSAKAQDLLRVQYAAVGAAARTSVPASMHALALARKRLAGDAAGDAGAVLERLMATDANVGRFTEAYRNYCWTVTSVDDYELAPFHVLATEGQVHVDKSHPWHMHEINSFAVYDECLFKTTKTCLVNLDDEASVQEATQWWLALTEAAKAWS